MRTVRPLRGESWDGASDRLLARAIVPSRRGHPVVLASLKGRRHPNHKMSLIPSRKAIWPGLTLLFVLAATTYGLLVGGQVIFLYGQARDGIEALADDFSEFGRVGHFSGIRRGGKKFNGFDHFVVEVQ